MQSMRWAFCFYICTFFLVLNVILLLALWVSLHHSLVEYLALANGELIPVHSLKSLLQITNQYLPGRPVMSSNSSKKVVFVSYVPQQHDSSHAVYVRATCRRSSTAIVVERNQADQISIQGYPSVPYRDKHKCWSLFQVSQSVLL